MKIQILLFYYERHKFIINALNSIKMQNYTNWELHFIDDGSINNPGENIVRNLFSTEELSKTIFYNTHDSIEDKISRGGSIFGSLANEAMIRSDADITIMLCDDDALYTDYLYNLSIFYQNHLNIDYAYSHVCIFNPFTERIDNNLPVRPWFLNRHTQPISPSDTVDASQVSWRRSKAIEKNIRFPYPKTANLDSFLYKQMFREFGPCVFTGFISQYKAIHHDQLGKKHRLAPIKSYITDEG